MYHTLYQTTFLFLCLGRENIFHLTSMYIITNHSNVIFNKRFLFRSDIPIRYDSSCYRMISLYYVIVGCKKAGLDQELIATI